MNPNAQNQHQQKQQPARDTFEGSTYYLVPSEEPDREMALAYLREKGVTASKKVRIVDAIDMARLTDEHRVIALSRNTKGDRNTVETVQGEDGRTKRVVKTRHADIKECEPIYLSKYWFKPETPDSIVDEFADGSLSDGELNVAKFLEELGKRIVPATLSYHPDRGEPLRIRYA